MQQSSIPPPVRQHRRSTMAKSVSEETAAKETYYFDLLDPPNQERVTILMEQFIRLLPIEQAAFLQDLGLRRISSGADEEAASANKGRLAHYSTDRLKAVQSREAGYITTTEALRGSAVAIAAAVDAAHQNSDTTTALTIRESPQDEIRKLLAAPGLFGDDGMKMQVNRLSLYDKLHQQMKQRSSTAERSSMAASRRGSDDADDDTGAESMQGSSVVGSVRSAVAETASNASAGQPPAPASTVTVASGAPNGNDDIYRSIAYQAARLAMSYPGYINSAPPPADSSSAMQGVCQTLNLTGLPIFQEELRVWFNSIDKDNRGELQLETFLNHIDSLERSFGAPHDFDELKREGERLATSGNLCFEAFAYLVLRFVRT